MITTESIYTWAKSHSRKETDRIIMSGQRIYFMQEMMYSSEGPVATALTAAYLYLEIERERKSMMAKETYKQRLESGSTLQLYFGFRPYTFEPDENARVIREMFIEASEGVEVEEIAYWLNDCGFRTAKGKEFTCRSVRSILTNPVYVGDLKLCGNLIADHHEAIVDRAVWKEVEKMMTEPGRERKSDPGTEPDTEQKMMPGTEPVSHAKDLAA